jgi:hypothetical protein
MPKRQSPHGITAGFPRPEKLRCFELDQGRQSRQEQDIFWYFL